MSESNLIDSLLRDADAAFPAQTSPTDSSGSDPVMTALDDEGVDDPAVRERLYRLAQLESSGGKNTTGPLIKTGMHAGDRARGAFQIMPKTFAEVMPEGDIGDETQANRAGVRYFMQNLKRFGGNLDAATLAHHAGPGTAQKWLNGEEITVGDGNMRSLDYLERIRGSAPKQSGQYDPSLDETSRAEERQAIRQIRQEVADESPIYTSARRGLEGVKHSVGLAVDNALGDTESAAQRITDKRQFDEMLPETSSAQAFNKDWANLAEDDYGGMFMSMLSNPAGVSQMVLEQAPNSLPGLAFQVAAGLGSKGLMALGPVGAAAGMALQGAAAFAGNLLPEGGAFIEEQLQKAGVDTNDPAAVKAWLDENREANLVGGAKKAAVISATDAVTGWAAMKMMAGPSLRMAKAEKDFFSKAGVDLANDKAVQAARASDAYKAAIQPYAADLMKSQEKFGAFKKAVASTGMESVGEGVGEYGGQYAATGDASVKDAVLEGAMGGWQGAVMAGTGSAAKALSGVNPETEALRALATYQPKPDSPLTNAANAGKAAQAAAVAPTESAPQSFGSPELDGQYATIAAFMDAPESIAKLRGIDPDLPAQAMHVWKNVINNTGLPLKTRVNALNQAYATLINTPNFTLGGQQEAQAQAQQPTGGALATIQPGETGVGPAAPAPEVDPSAGSIPGEATRIAGEIEGQPGRITSESGAKTPAYAKKAAEMRSKDRLLSAPKPTQTNGEPNGQQPLSLPNQSATAEGAAAKPVADANAGHVEAETRAPSESVAEAPEPARAYKKDAAGRMALSMTRQGVPTVAVPHPTQAGMYMLQPAEEGQAQPAQVAPTETKPAVEQPARRAGRKVDTKIDPEADSLFTAIAKLGGISADDVFKGWGHDPADFKNGRMVGFGLRVVKKNGALSADGALESLKQYGYFGEDATLADLEQAFADEASGNLHLTPEGRMRGAERAAEAQYAAMTEAEAVTQGTDLDARTEALQDEAEHVAADIAEEVAAFDIPLPDDVALEQSDDAQAAGMRALGFTEEEIQDALNPTNQGAVSSAAEEGAAGRTEEAGARRADDGFSLEQAQNGREEVIPDGDGITKEQADKERDAVPFSLATQSQPKPVGVQSGLFTADGRVAKDATAAPAVSEMDALKAEMGQAIGELASILGVKTNMTPEEEVRILPVMSKIFRIAAKMGYITFKDAAVHVVKQLRELGGKELADKISIDNLQSGYINIAKEIGGSKKEALEYESLDELMAGHDALVESIAAAEKKTDINPSSAQKEAENYRKGKFQWNGWTIAVETPKGAERTDKETNGEKWRVKMRTTYGYFLGTKGADKDHVDVFVGDHPESNKVFIIDQNKVDSQAFDEHKVMIGFTSADDAQAEYLLSFSGTFGGRVFGRISDALTPEQLKEVMPSLAKKKPFTKPAEEFNYVEPAPGNETPARTELKKVVDNTQAPSVAEPKGWRTSWGTASKYAEALGLSTRNAAGKSMKLPELTAAIEAKLSGAQKMGEPQWWIDRTPTERYRILSASGIGGTASTKWSSLSAEQQTALNEQWAPRQAPVEGTAQSEQFKNYANWIEGGKEITPGLLEQIRADERLNDGEADKLVAMAESKKPASVKDLALAEQRAAGWNPDWPFIPADLGNADFRSLIASDSSLSDEEKAQIFSAGKKLGVIPQEEQISPASKIAQIRAKSGKTEPIKLSNITVQVSAIVEETGEAVKVNERADVALSEIDQRIELAKGLLECLVS